MLRSSLWVAVPALTLLCVATAVHSAPGYTAARGAVVERGGNDRTAVDWTRGLLVATGAAAGDLRAPSPQVARVAAARRARQQARTRLLKRARALALGGKSVAEHAEADERVAQRLDRLTYRSLKLAIEYGSDGSVVATEGLALEAVRLAVRGVAPAAPTSDKAATAILVDARRVMARAALGVELEAGEWRYSGPTVFYRDLERAAADPRVGRRPLRVRATGRKQARLSLARTKKKGSALARAGKAGALVVIVIGKGT